MKSKLRISAFQLHVYQAESLSHSTIPLTGRKSQPFTYMLLAENLSLIVHETG